MADSQPPEIGSQDQAGPDIDAHRALRQHLAALSRIGVDSLPKGGGRFRFAAPSFASETEELVETAAVEAPDVAINKPPASTMHVGEQRPTTRFSRTNLLEENSYAPSLSLDERQNQLQILEQEVSGCTRCRELVSNRTQTVFGVGPLTPRLVFVGEGPGADEDRTGEPFVGAAGKLLNKIIGACQLRRDEVYILNTVKCRPPGNRNPSPSELDNCWGFAERQLDILQPEFICCLGSVAAKRVLNTTQSLGRLRQQFHQYRGSRVLVTYHPAYLLRTESAKRHVWEDMKMLMKELGIDLTN